MAKFKAGDTAWVKVVLKDTPFPDAKYPLSADVSEGYNLGTLTREGNIHVSDKSPTYLTEDEARGILEIKKPKDEMRYFYVILYVKDARGGDGYVSIPISHPGMFSSDRLEKHVKNEVYTTLSVVQIISWQELTKEDYEAFTA